MHNYIGITVHFISN